MIELHDLNAARRSTFACLVWGAAEGQYAIRVSPRDPWLILSRELSTTIRTELREPRIEGRRPPHLSYRRLIELARNRRENAMARLLTLQLANATRPTHSHAPPNWRPPIRLTKTMVPTWGGKCEVREQRYRRQNRHDSLTTIYTEEPPCK